MHDPGGPSPHAAGDDRARVTRWFERTRTRVALDALGWVVAILGGFLARFDVELPVFWRDRAIILIGIAVVGQVVAGFGSGLYRGRWRPGSLDEVSTVGVTIFGITALLLGVNLVRSDRLAPNGVVAMAGAIALLLAGTTRYLLRRHRDRRRSREGSGIPALVFGAGDAGAQLVTSMVLDERSRYRPVAILDDDPSKQRLEIRGIPVVGGRGSLEATSRDLAPEVVIIAIPSAPGDVIRALSRAASDLGLDVKVLPPLDEILDGTVVEDDVRPLEPADLLGRRPIDTDLGSIAGYVTGKTVLVTGAGGSIGSELCRQLTEFEPSSLVMLDRDESALHAVQLSIEGRAMLDTRNVVVCDIRDRARVFEVFDEHRPDVVFHAAALKHLPLLEMYPGEAVKTNVWATQHVLDAAVQVGVVRFVNVSTDKAAGPTSVLGYTKRIAERLTTSVAAYASGTYVSVRFGNVLGSRGSVLTAFAGQINSGGPVTVTDPDVTRYFMTVQEAVQLVIQAGAIGRPGEALVLDMGEPIRIADVAQQMIAQSDHDIEIVFTGLRPGEKLHEILIGPGEVDHRPRHHLISHVVVPPLPVEAVSAFDTAAPTTAQIAELADLCGGLDLRDGPTPQLDLAR